MPVQDLATSEVVTVEPDTPVSEVAQTLDEENVGSVVVTKSGKAVGVLTDRDVAVRVAAEERDAANTTAEEVMSEEPLTVSPEDGFADAARKMRDNAIRRLPVVDDEGDVHGIITSDDMTAAIADEQGMLADVVREQASG